MIVLAVLETFGVVNLSTDVFQNLVLWAIGVVVLALLADSFDRRSPREEQRRLVHAAEAAAGVLPVHEVPSDRIGEGLASTLERSDRWIFRGGSGRYLRNRTLPTLATARDRDTPLLVEILDPRDAALVREYARYRAQQRADSVRRPDEADPRTIASDLLANVYAAAWYTVNTRIRAEVLLLRSFSPLRYDIGSTALYVTVPDPTEPGLVARAGSWYYAAILDELQQNAHGHPQLVLPSDSKLFPERHDEVSPDVVLAGLQAVRVRDPVTQREAPLLTGAVAPEMVDPETIAHVIFLRDAPY